MNSISSSFFKGSVNIQLDGLQYPLLKLSVQSTVFNKTLKKESVNPLLNMYNKHIRPCFLNLKWGVIEILPFLFSIYFWDQCSDVANCNGHHFVSKWAFLPKCTAIFSTYFLQFVCFFLNLFLLYTIYMNFSQNLYKKHTMISSSSFDTLSVDE